MAAQKSEKQFMSMFIILISLFILIFFTRNIYSEMTLNSATNDAKNIELEELVSKAAELGKRKEQLDAASDGENNENSKYLRLIEEGKISSIESDIMADIYGFTDRETEFGAILINSINFSEKETTEFGFDQVSITLNARVPNQEMMMRLLKHIINNEEYQFFINSFSIPEDTTGGFVINVPIKMIFKELKELKKEPVIDTELTEDPTEDSNDESQVEVPAE